MTELRKKVLGDKKPRLPYVILDDKGRVDFVHPKICGLIGYDRDEIEGRHFYRFLSKAPYQNALTALDFRIVQTLNDGVPNVNKGELASQYEKDHTLIKNRFSPASYAQEHRIRGNAFAQGETDGDYLPLMIQVDHGKGRVVDLESHTTFYAEDSKYQGSLVTVSKPRTVSKMPNIWKWLFPQKKTPNYEVGNDLVLDWTHITQPERVKNEVTAEYMRDIKAWEKVREKEDTPRRTIVLDFNYTTDLEEEDVLYLMNIVGEPANNGRVVFGNVHNSITSNIKFVLDEQFGKEPNFKTLIYPRFEGSLEGRINANIKKLKLQFMFDDN
jgi:hypothetical protein